MRWIFLPLIGTLGGVAGVYFWRSYRHLRPGPQAVERRMIMRGPLTRANLFTAEGWALRLRGWIFSGLALLLLAVWGLWEMRAQ